MDLSEVIAILALFASGIVAIIHYNNQRERRHGEIVQLRSDILNSVAIQKQRSANFKLLAEALRLELRLLSDCNDKYESIEAIPSLLEVIDRNSNSVETLRRSIENIDTQRANHSKSLMILQSAKADLNTLNSQSDEVEKKMMSVLDRIRLKTTNTTNEAIS